MFDIKNNSLFFNDLRISSGTHGDMERLKYRLNHSHIFPTPDPRHEMSRNFILPGDVVFSPRSAKFIVFKNGDSGYDLKDGSQCWIPYYVCKVAV